ncbi:MAG: 4Fe-4S binding protein, partial [Actinomycetota bacterium]|nr:4Fe-4S binding protein [Actinomycetota bacterium]
MTYVITQNCCNDATCAEVCPVDAIHPTPGEAGYATTEMLYIDPGACIDCGACLEACPVDAAHPADELPDPLTRYIEINAGYYRANPTPASPTAWRVEPKPVSSTAEPLRVAIVGSGPSGFYAAAHLLKTSGAPVEVSMFDRLPTPFGLVRAGVAPDHPHTKQVTDLFRWTAAHPSFHTYLNVEIGRHLDHAELLEYHHAVVYAVGAADDRRLDIPGEDLPGSHPATDFVAWYNGHPDYASHTFDLNHKRAVVIGNGNVALDVTRVLLLDADSLARTDIADHALAALAVSNIEEVVVVGRRGPAQAACTTPELLALGDLDGIEVVVDPRGMPPSDEPATFTARLKGRVLGELAAAPRPGTKRIVLRFLSTPVDILGADHVEGLELARNRIVRDQAGALVAEPTGETETIDTGLVLRA